MTAESRNIFALAVLLAVALVAVLAVLGAPESRRSRDARPEPACRCSDRCGGDRADRDRAPRCPRRDGGVGVAK